MNKNISATYEGWIDLFGWGTSGYHNPYDDTSVNYQPWATSTSEINNIKKDSTLNCEIQHITGECKWEYTYIDAKGNKYGYGPSSYWGGDYSGYNYDWGVYNAISNGGNKAGLWRTLTIEEWRYLLFKRTNAEYLWSDGKVNGISGTIILCDDFVKPSSVSWTNKATNDSTNTYTLEQWKIMETAGAVFLPYSIPRYGKDIPGAHYCSCYWSITIKDYKWANSIAFCSYEILVDERTERCEGLNVRLVQDVK